MFSVVYSIYDRLDYASAVLALQKSNDSLIHRMQAGGCIWEKKVECDRFKNSNIQMGGTVQLSVIVLVLSFLLQPAIFDILAYKTKQQSFR